MDFREFIELCDTIQGWRLVVLIITALILAGMAIDFIKETVRHLLIKESNNNKPLIIYTLYCIVVLLIGLIITIW